MKTRKEIINKNRKGKERNEEGRMKRINKEA
jgi:hypothetical protein